MSKWYVVYWRCCYHSVITITSQAYFFAEKLIQSLISGWKDVQACICRWFAMFLTMLVRIFDHVLEFKWRPCCKWTTICFLCCIWTIQWFKTNITLQYCLLEFEFHRSKCMWPWQKGFSDVLGSLLRCPWFYVSAAECHIQVIDSIQQCTSCKWSTFPVVFALEVSVVARN